MRLARRMTGGVARCLRHLVFGVSVATAAAGAHAQTQPEVVRVSAAPGEATRLGGDYACAVVTRQPSAGRAGTSTVDGKVRVVLFSEQTQQNDDSVFVETGTKDLGSGKCDQAAETRFLVSFQHTPTVSPDALGKSFNVLVAALVLALLLESAFELLFNWRLFQVYLIGRAWRTPIMLVGSWLVVEAFRFDLMAALMAAYYPSPGAKPSHSAYTSLLTAMVLAGGSGGVHRILVALGFRSPLHKVEAEREDLRQKGDAWVSVKVRSAQQAQVRAVEVTAPGDTLDVPTTYGLTKVRKPSLLELLFGDLDRVPHSGGFRLSSDRCYRFTVAAGNDIYDLDGRKLATPASARAYRFAPGAIFDFNLYIPKDS